MPLASAPRRNGVLTSSSTSCGSNCTNISNEGESLNLKLPDVQMVYMQQGVVSQKAPCERYLSNVSYTGDHNQEKYARIPFTAACVFRSDAS